MVASSSCSSTVYEDPISLLCTARAAIVEIVLTLEHDTPRLTQLGDYCL